MYDNQSTTSPLKSRFRCYTESPTVPANTSLINSTGSVQEMGTLSWECPGDGDTVLGASRRWGHCPGRGQEMGTLFHARKSFHVHVHVHQYITCTKYDHS